MSDFRYLTEGEKNLGRQAYGDSIDYSSVRVYHDRYVSLQSADTTLTPNGSMYFARDKLSSYTDDFSLAGDRYKEHFIHELGHVYQHQRGENVLAKAIALGIISGNFTGAGDKYKIRDLRVASWGSLNIEQRAQLVADYWSDNNLGNGVNLNKLSLMERILPSDVVRPKLFDNVPVPSEKPGQGPAQCFPRNTEIHTLAGKKSIGDIEVGDVVFAFDPSVDRGRGKLVGRRVQRLFRNVTTEWLRLTWIDQGKVAELICTPGHHFLDQFGNFPRIEEMVRGNNAAVVLSSGELAQVAVERITYNAQSAGLFEAAANVYVTEGTVARQPFEVEGWQTYNFEVEELHTYVAGDVRVHNISNPWAHEVKKGVDTFLRAALIANLPLDYAASMSRAVRGVEAGPNGSPVGYTASGRTITLNAATYNRVIAEGGGNNASPSTRAEAAARSAIANGHSRADAMAAAYKEAEAAGANTRDAGLNALIDRAARTPATVVHPAKEGEAEAPRPPEPQPNRLLFPGPHLRPKTPQRKVRPARAAAERARPETLPVVLPTPRKTRPARANRRAAGAGHPASRYCWIWTVTVSRSPAVTTRTCSSISAVMDTNTAAPGLERVTVF